MYKSNIHIFLLSFLISLQVSAQTTTFIDWNSQWSYFKGIQEPSQPNTLWRGKGFNDSGWQKGNAPFRYGDGSGGTLLSDMINNYTTFYIRKEFVINNTDDVDQLKITVDYDDGFVIWINGNEVWKINVTDNYAYNSGAINPHEFGEWSSLILNKKDLNLVNGTNLIAIQGFNFSKTSSDFYLNVKLDGIKKLPETDAVVTIDIKSGFYNSPFWAKLSGSAPGETIFYTMDGSDPRTSSTVLTGKSPVNVWIDPNSAEGGRGKTGGVVVRASQINPGLAPGKPTTNSYIFVSAVKTQPHPGGSWPTNNVNGQLIDLPMDSKVYNDARYNKLMESSLIDIPTISVTTDPDNLFGSQQGIYVNAEYHGREWERPANIELINPDGSPGFNINAGIRIRGGWSRHDDYPKHAFRLFFRSEYGAGKLNFPLFGDEGV
ncbi:MAG: chitobiase/beta-hexosaminidase C-terminal domain-containing protein, partial [Draconibacterium sp.]|nr:chitobiase/beta-hexosaminidase C-terminal domain-containing protein [Draconibacterium sp.]